MEEEKKPKLSAEQEVALQSLEASQAMEDEMITSEEAIAKAVVTLSKTPDEQVMSEFRGIEVKLLTATKTIGDKYDVPSMKELVRNFGRFRVSLDRKGRGELVSLARSAREEVNAKAKLKNFLSFGRG